MSLAALALLLASSAAANPPQARLVIFFGDRPATVLSYANLASCEVARLSLLRQARESEQPAPKGVSVVRRRINAYCIPG